MNDRSSEANSKTLAIAEKRRKQKRRNVIIMSVMAGTAYFLRFKGVLFGGVMSTDLMDILGYLRPSLYAAIYLYWWTTIKRRIVQDQVRVCLESIAYLFFIWFTFVRSNSTSSLIRPDGQDGRRSLSRKRITRSRHGYSGICITSQS